MREAGSATRERLLEAASRLFAERGFQGVTVRQLCREAEANVAAVNYHFGDKLGLYRAVLETAFAHAEADPTTDVPADTAPEARIRHYVATFLPRLAAPGEKGVRIQCLMRHELNDPTSLAPWIWERVLRRRLRFLAEAVAELLGTGTSDPRVGRSVMSLQAQCLFYQPSRFAEAAVPGWHPPTPEEIEAAVEHVVAFTLAGIGGVRQAG